MARSGRLRGGRRWRPTGCGYGFDVIARIGWERQAHCQRFASIYEQLRPVLEISQTHVRNLYHTQYLPLLACHEREHRARLEATGHNGGLLLSLDGLMPEGGEPQLWVVRELRTELTLRSGWLSGQDEATFVAFLAPIAALGLPVTAVLSDKQQGLLPAVAQVFPNSRHAFCQLHYLNNAVAPVAEADETMKVTLRKAVRAEVGDLVRREQAAGPGVLTVTGLVPSPVDTTGATTVTPDPDPDPDPARVTGADAVSSLDQERQLIVQSLVRRVRYLLTLKGRPPYRLAGIEMYQRLQEVLRSLNRLIGHHADARLIRLRDGLRQALSKVRADYIQLRRAAKWLHAIARLLDADGKPPRSGTQVQEAVETYLDQITPNETTQPRLWAFYHTLVGVTTRYAPGLFHCYDVPDLPRTNNARESEFRDLQRRMLVTTGQKGLARRLIQREGAWELIPRPDSLADTISALAHVQPEDLARERLRVQTHPALPPPHPLRQACPRPTRAPGETLV